jgi:hypothetical protein
MKIGNRVFYNGRRYEFKITATEDGKRHFSLYKNGTLAHFVAEDALDNRWPLTILLDQYLNELKVATPS